MKAPETDPDAGLRAFVQEHRVSAEVAAHFDLEARRRIQSALDLCLFARRSHLCRGDPGCGECIQVWGRLRELALRVLPPGARFSIDPFDASFHLRREARWEPEIELVVEIFPLDLGAGLEPVDDAARRVVAVARAQLERLGVAYDLWRPRAM